MSLSRPKPLQDDYRPSRLRKLALKDDIYIEQQANFLKLASTKLTEADVQRNIRQELGQPAHWYEEWKAGYRAEAWPKDERDTDDGRYDLKEKES